MRLVAWDLAGFGQGRERSGLPRFLHGAYSVDKAAGPPRKKPTPTDLSHWLARPFPSRTVSNHATSKAKDVDCLAENIKIGTLEKRQFLQ